MKRPPNRGDIDDAVLLAMAIRCRAEGFDAYLVPQAVRAGGQLAA